MFQISFFCKDNKLAEILLLLDGKAYDLKTVPVQVKVDTEPMSAAQRARDAVEAFPGKKVTTMEIAKLTQVDVSLVRSALNGMVEKGELRHTGRGEYTKKGAQA